MKETDEKIKMRKRNMKIFPLYKALAWDYLFYYTIDFLFLTQVKNMSAATVVLKEAFYSFFSIILQIPANIVIEVLGRRNSIILANILNCLYMLVLMLSRNLGDLIFAEFICAIAFSIKDSAQPSLLGASIPPSRYKSKIYSSINARGASTYYALNAISKILSGFLFTINGYLPMTCSLIVLVIATIMSTAFIEPVKKTKVKVDEVLGKEQLKETKDGFIYILKSERLKALILCAALIAALITISNTYHVSLLEDLKVSAAAIGIISAVGSFLSSFASRMQDQFHRRLRNKSLLTLAYLLSIGCFAAGVFGIVSQTYRVFIAVIVITSSMHKFCEGMYHNLIDKYLSNFANKHIDTRIFSANQLFVNIIKTIVGMFSAFLIDKMATTYCMIIMGIVFTVFYILLGNYMKTRVGLKPEQYSKEEKKYDEQKLLEENVLK